MAEGARVDDVDALRLLRVAVVKFSESAQVALDTADAEISSTINWLEGEQSTYWASQVRKRHDKMVQAEEALRQKRIFKDSSGRTPQAVEEMKAVAVTKRRIEEAKNKHAAVRKAIGLLNREGQNYKGGVQRLATDLQTTVPSAVAMLDAIVVKLDEYANLQATLATSQAGPLDMGVSMSRPIESEASMARPVEGGADHATEAEES